MASVGIAQLAAKPICKVMSMIAIPHKTREVTVMRVTPTLRNQRVRPELS